MLKFLLIIGLFHIFANAMEITYDYSERIVNGYDIKIEEVPYQVGIFYKNLFACGGSIIADKFILTAAHCLGNDKLMIHAGSSKLKKGGSYHTSVNVTVHENYNQDTYQYDIGLIEIHPLLPYDETRKPIKLLKDPTLLKEGDMALITGWGTDSEGGEIATYLQAVQVPIISHKSCRKQYGIESEINERQICAGYPEGKKDSCQGDSGGPLVVRDQLAGIVSWGKGCARAGLPGVYTNVAHYIDWIEKHTANPTNRFDGKIVGGRDIDITIVPHQVSLFRSGIFLCGGSIISENYILTAGHCATGSSYTVRAGSNYIGKNGTEHEVTEVIRHENYGTNKYGIINNDIALMKVEPPFEFDGTRKPVSLMQKGATLAAGHRGLVTGWGRLTEGGSAPKQLQGVSVPLISKESCREQYSFIGDLPEGQICAAYPQGGKDACQGDSGGPFVVDGYLAGIVSWGVGCARPSMPGVYTEVSYFRDWIKEHSQL